MRVRISLTIFSAMAWRLPVSARVSKNRLAAARVSALSSKMARPATVTWRASRRRREPLHSGQERVFRYLASYSRTTIESVSR